MTAAAAFAQNDAARSLHPGDLLFVTGRDSEFSKAIVEATAHDKVGRNVLEGMKFDHVAIFDRDSVGAPVVIEATSRCGGVTVNTWDDFAGHAPCVLAIGLTAPLDTLTSLDRAKSHIGEPYDWDFASDNDMCYCSELVQISYITPAGKPLFRTRPMNFLDSDGKMPEFWTNLFAKSDKKVPQGAPGTNPNDMAADALAIGKIKLLIENDPIAEAKPQTPVADAKK